MSIGDGRTVKTQGVGDPTGGKAVVGSAEPVRPLDGVTAGGQQLVVAVCQSDENASLRSGNARRVEPGMFERIPGRLQQQAVLRIDRDGLPLGHPEEVAVEAADVVEEGSPPRHRPAGHTGLGVVVHVGVPSVRGYFTDEVVTAQQCVPQTLRGINPPGKSAGHTDDCHGRDGCLTHRWVPLFSPAMRGRPIGLKTTEEFPNHFVPSIILYVHDQVSSTRSGSLAIDVEGS